MILQRNTPLVISLLIFSLISILYVISRQIILSGFMQIEQAEVRKNVERGVDVINADFDDLLSTSGDWAQWDDAYNFVQTGTPSFVKTNLIDGTFRNLRLNLMLFVNASGKLVNGEAYDLVRDQRAPLPLYFQNLSPNDPLLRVQDMTQVHAGILVLPEGALMLVARPILTSQSQGPAAGTLLMGRYLDAALVNRFSETIHTKMIVYRLNEPALGADMALIRDALIQTRQPIVRPIDEQTIAGYDLLPAINGEPALILGIQTDRPIYAQALNTMSFAALGALIVIVLFGVVMYLFVRQMMSEERYSLAVRGSNDGLWDWNVRTGKVYYSPRWKDLLGYREDELTPKLSEWTERIHPDDRAKVEREIQQHLAGGTPYLNSEHRIKRRDGSFIWVQSRGIAVRDRAGRVLRMAGSLTDIMERKHVEEKLLYDALHDPLTNLANRTLFMERLASALARTKRLPELQHGVIYLDLDRFKTVNDHLGHPAGDRLLAACAQSIKAVVRAVDTVARLGGDEFIILLESIHAASQITAIAERLLAELASPYEIDGQKIYTSASLGVVLVDAHYTSADQVLRDADIALYRAKGQGRAQYQVFDPLMRDDLEAKLALEEGLRHGIERHEFELDYQPILSLANLQIAGFEALVRWRHSSRGVILPSEFIPVAEESGLILPLGDWILREACAQLRAWQLAFPALPPFTISVNLSAKQFAQPDLPQRIASILHENHLRPEHLSLEITESAIMVDAAASAAMFARLLEMGIEVQIDDFGIGYSSLSYLQLFPFTALKIDGSFVRNLKRLGNGNGTNGEIVRTIITLAEQLGLTVIAEGVETVDQFLILKSLNCKLAQGYLISPPLDSETVQRFIAANGLFWNLPQLAGAAPAQAH